MIMSDSNTALYRHYDIHNQLLYIGISVSPTDRFEGHRNRSEWAYLSIRIEMEWFDSREEALAAEKQAIENEHPKFNKMHSKINRKIKVNLSATSEIFQFQNNPLRVFTDQDGNPWFIAKDVAEILDYSDAHKMASKLDDDEKSNREIGGLGPATGGRGITLINESGLYSVVLTSQKPQAKTFKRWVTHEVLPSIRKTGSYTKQPKKLQFSDRSISDCSIIDLPVSKIEIEKRRKFLMEIVRQHEEQEEKERLERLAQPKPEPINLSSRAKLKNLEDG
jgi:prophage antirepressor-like protein